jgi:dTDP-4-dehydrorhamnose 3,5-epimerase-like enzyme
MQRIETSLPGMFDLRPVIHRDARGFFIETYHKAKFAVLGITDAFDQDNHSRFRLDLPTLPNPYLYPSIPFENTIIVTIGQQACITWNDPDLKIHWGVTAPISAKDSEYPTLAHAPCKLLPEHPVK